MRQILLFRGQKKPSIKLFPRLSSTCEFRQRAGATADSQLLPFQQLTHKFSLFSPFTILSLSLQLFWVLYLSCHCLFTCHLSYFPWQCIFVFPALSQTYSTQPLRDLSLPVPSLGIYSLFPWVMLCFCMVIFWSALPYFTLDMPSEYKCVFLVGLFLSLLYFQIGHSFQCLGTGPSDLHHIPIARQPSNDATRGSVLWISEWLAKLCKLCRLSEAAPVNYTGETSHGRDAFTGSSAQELRHKTTWQML